MNKKCFFILIKYKNFYDLYDTYLVNLILIDNAIDLLIKRYKNEPFFIVYHSHMFYTYEIYTTKK